MKKIDVYDLFISDENIEGLTAMGLVDNPAIQQNFLYFKNENIQNKYIMANVDSEKKMVVGPALIPEKKIIRQDYFGDLYYVKFNTDLVERLAHNFLKDSKQHLTTEQHENPIKGVYMVESWIAKNEQDKIYTEYNYSIEDVKLGSWCIMYKIENDDIINKIKAGEINGFSIEAFLSEKISAKSQVETLLEKVEKNEEKELIYNILKKEF